jgi:hypothetical protein
VATQQQQQQRQQLCRVNRGAGDSGSGGSSSGGSRAVGRAAAARAVGAETAHGLVLLRPPPGALPDCCSAVLLEVLRLVMVTRWRPAVMVAAAPVAAGDLLLCVLVACSRPVLLVCWPPARHLLVTCSSPACHLLVTCLSRRLLVTCCLPSLRWCQADLGHLPVSHLPVTCLSPVAQACQAFSLTSARLQPPLPNPVAGDSPAPPGSRQRGRAAVLPFPKRFALELTRVAAAAVLPAAVVPAASAGQPCRQRCCCSPACPAWTTAQWLGAVAFLRLTELVSPCGPGPWRWPRLPGSNPFQEWGERRHSGTLDSQPCPEPRQGSPYAARVQTRETD